MIVNIQGALQVKMHGQGGEGKRVPPGGAASARGVHEYHSCVGGPRTMYATLQITGSEEAISDARAKREIGVDETKQVCRLW